MNDHRTNNADGDRDSDGGTISSHRRSLANISLEIIAAGHAIERLSKLVDKVPSARRQLEIVRACDEIAEHRGHIEAVEKHLREVAEDTHVELYVVRRRRRLLARIEAWLFGDP